MPGRFITHYSVEELVAIAEDREALPTVVPDLLAGYAALLAQLQALPKPVIVAMTGDTMGGGLELSLAADLRIAEEGPYRIGLLETRLGIIPGGGGDQRLARMIGPAAAIEIVMRGLVFTLAPGGRARPRARGGAGRQGTCARDRPRAERAVPGRDRPGQAGGA